MTWSCSRLLPRCCTSNMISKVNVFIFLLCVTGTFMLWSGDISSYNISSYNITSYFLPRDERPCACDRCLSEDESLFMKRFSKCDHPFLSLNHNLSEDTFNWWRKIALHGQQNFSTYKETVKRVLQMFPTSAEVEASSPDRCRTCAVVGNSVNLNNSHYGPLIDFQDVVIRINGGRTKGYEADVGTRTTHRVMYPESAVDLDNETHLVFFPFKIMDLEWIMNAFSAEVSGRSNGPIKSKIKANKDLVMVISPAFMRCIHQVWLKRNIRYASTGFMALVLALHICDEVHVFGFGADSEGRWSHYWEKLKNRKFKTGRHPGNVEYAIIQKLDHQILTFYKGW